VAHVIGDLAGERHVTCVLVGSRSDAATAGAIHRSLDAATAQRTIDLTGGTTIGELAGILALARGCVANDSGAMHLAAAVGTSLVALFGPTRESETAPLRRTGRHAELLTAPVWCRPCMLRECPIDHRCMRGITPDRALAALDRVMDPIGAGSSPR
jgi:heptosyltransferase-2